MKNKKLKSTIQLLIISGSVIFFIACNNSDYTKSPPPTDSENARSSSDTSMNKVPVNAGTSSGSSSLNNKQMAASRKKGKITIGAMTARTSSVMKADKNGVYNRTEVSPAYPGGHNALEDYFNNNIEYPETAIDNNSEGTVDVQFVVDENGKVSNARVIGKTLGNGLDEEAVRVVSDMPKWTPGKAKGKDVKTRIVLPVTYKMEE